MTLLAKTLPRTLPTSCVALLVLVVLCLSISNKAAATLVGFDPGNIISDFVMSDKNTMTQSQIQTFLKSKNSCNSTGSTTGGTTIYNINPTDANGNPVPLNQAVKGYRTYSSGNTYWWNLKNSHFVCMADNNFSGESAAKIIYDAAQYYSINPQALIVLLEKEQGLVRDGYPNDHQYAAATGYDCPDTPSGCNNANAGFKNQIRKAAALFREVLDGGWSNYPVGTNYIQYNPNTRCGGSNVNITNRATSALYRYTPYQPNKYAMSGGSDSSYPNCGAFGNRNFYDFFTNWFGSTQTFIDSSGLLLYGWSTGDKITAVFDIKNITNSMLNVDYIRVRAVNQSGDQYLFSPKSGLVLAPGERYTYKQSVIIDKEGVYNFTIDRKVGTTWKTEPFSDFNYTGTTKITRTIAHKPSITSSLSLNRSSVHVNEPVTASFNVLNNSSLRSASIGTLRTEAFLNGQQYVFGSDENILLQPNASYLYSKTTSINKVGTYKFNIVNYTPSTGWNSTYPISDNTDISRTIDVNVKDQVTITQGLSLDKYTAREGDTITANFKVKNFGTTPVNVGLLKVEAFGADGKQYQFNSTDATLTLAPGEEHTYTQSRLAPPKGAYTFRIVNKGENVGWNHSLPASETPNIARQTKLIVKYPVDVVSSLSITPSDLKTGDTATATFVVKNFGVNTVDVGLLKVETYGASTKNYQFGSTGSHLTLAPGETYTYTRSLALSTKGVYYFRIVNKNPTTGWNITLPSNQDGSILRTQKITVS